MNDPYTSSGSESPRGTSMLGPAVPPRDSGDQPRRGVIDGAAGPFLGREREAPDAGRALEQKHSTPTPDRYAETQRTEEPYRREDLPWIEPAVTGPTEPEPRGEDTAAGFEAHGEEIITSGVLGDREVVPIESLAPEAGAGAAEEMNPVLSGSAGADQERSSGESSLRDHEVEMAEPAGRGIDQEPEDVDTSWPAEEGAYAGFEEEGGWDVDGGDELRSESGEAEVYRAAEAAPEPGSEMASSDASGDDGAAYAGGGAGFGEDPYWEPWVEPSGSDAAVGGDHAATAWAAAAMGGEGYGGETPPSGNGDDEEHATNLASPLLNEAIPGASSAVLEAIAERLERIARSLRARDENDVGGDASDPLEVLITGYALGYSEGVKSVGGSPRDEP